MRCRGTVIAEQVGDGGVTRAIRRVISGEPCVIRSGAAEIDGLTHLQQVGVTEEFDLGDGAGIGPVSLGGGGAQSGGLPGRRGAARRRIGSVDRR